MWSQKDGLSDIKAAVLIVKRGNFKFLLFFFSKQMDREEHHCYFQGFIRKFFGQICVVEVPQLNSSLKAEVMFEYIG